MPKCDCGEDFQNQFLLNEHQSNNCTNRYTSCQLCDEYIQSCDLNHHLFYCASKTNQCPNCLKYIRRAIYNYHLENNCKDADEDIASDEDESKFNTIDTQSNDDTLIPCEICNREIEISSYEYHSKNCFKQPRSSFQLPRSIIDHSTYEQKADDELINSSTTDKTTRRIDVVSKLQKKTSDVRDSLSQNYYPNEIDHVTSKLEFNIIIMGAPRVGKSQLINALCDREELAETSPSLNSCTKEVKCYFIEDNQQRSPGIEPFRVNFYDTPGIESWTNNNGQETMLKFIEEKNPVCLIYCASPGSFADLKQLQPVLKFCKSKQIFCALVCTNMWSGNKRHEVIREFEKELEFFGDRNEKLFDQGYNRLPHKVIIFGHDALCTMVNSKEYSDQELSNKDMPVQGVDELIHCIMEELDEEKLLGWCNAVLYRRTYWEKITQRVSGFYSKYLSNLVYKTADQLAFNFTVYLVEKYFNKKK